MERWLIDAKLKAFSELLQWMDDEIVEEQSGNTIILTFELPQSIKANEDLIKLIETFYEKHQYRQESIEIKQVNKVLIQITIEGIKKSIDPTSFLFMKEYLSKLS